MKEQTLARLAWLLPFGVGGGMAFGALAGWSFRSEALVREGVSRHGAGAAGALLILACLLAGWVLSLLTVGVAKLLRRRAPSHLLLRLAASLASGGLVAMLAPGSRDSAAWTVWAAWAFLLGFPVLVSWPWRPRDPEPAP